MDVQLTALFGLGRRFGLEVLVPLRVTAIDAAFSGADGAELASFESIHHRDETIAGLGDPTVALRYTALPRQRAGAWALDVRGGLTLPFGGIEPDPFALGRAGQRHQHLFYGHGTFDPVLGLEATGRLGGLESFAFAVARAPLSRNRLGYRGSTQLSLGWSVGHALSTRDWLFFLLPELRHESAARWGDAPAENSGRTELALGAGAFWRASARVQAYAIVKRPVVLHAEGGQLSLPLSATLGLRWLLEP